MFSQASVILSTGGVWVDTPRADTSLGRPTGQTPHWADNPLGRHPFLGRQPPGQTPLPGQTLLPQQTATAADGTHPTGMHSCLMLILGSRSRSNVFNSMHFSGEKDQNNRLVRQPLVLAPPMWQILDPLL